MRSRALPWGPVFAALLAATGCASLYDDDWRFETVSGTADVSGPATRAGRLSATVLGIRTDDPTGRPAVDVGLRLERLGEAPVRIAGDALELDLPSHEGLRAAALAPRGLPVAPRGGATTWVATFPLPARDAASLDLASMSLAVGVEVGEPTGPAAAAASPRTSCRFDFRRAAEYVLWADPWDWPGPTWVGQPQGWRR